MKVTTMKIMNDFHYEWKPTTRLTLFVVSRDEGIQRRALVRMDCMYSSLSKGTSQAEVTLNNEKNKPIALAIVKLH